MRPKRAAGAAGHPEAQESSAGLARACLERARPNYPGHSSPEYASPERASPGHTCPERANSNGAGLNCAHASGVGSGGAHT